MKKNNIDVILSEILNTLPDVIQYRKYYAKEKENGYIYLYYDTDKKITQPGFMKTNLDFLYELNKYYSYNELLTFNKEKNDFILSDKVLNILSILYDTSLIIFSSLDTYYIDKVMITLNILPFFNDLTILTNSIAFYDNVQYTKNEPFNVKMVCVLWNNLDHESKRQQSIYIFLMALLYGFGEDHIIYKKMKEKLLSLL